MKFPIAYYLMLLYLAIMIRPLIPIMSNALSHTFAEAQHIATIHAKLGNNHLEDAMAKSGSDHEGKNHNTIKSDESMQVHLSVGEYLYDLPVKNVHANYFTPFSSALAHIYILKFIPPPRYC